MTSVERQIAEARKNPRARARMDQQRASLLLVRDLTAAFEASGLGLRELARRMSTSPSQVSRILEGETDTSLSTLWRFVRALGCTFELKVRPDIECAEPEVPEATSAKILGTLTAMRQDQTAQARETMEASRAVEQRLTQLESQVQALQWRLDPRISEDAGCPAALAQVSYQRRRVFKVVGTEEKDADAFSPDKELLS